MLIYLNLTNAYYHIMKLIKRLLGRIHMKKLEKEDNSKEVKK